jgi:cysteine synthase A
MRFNDMNETIGKTPLIRLNRVIAEGGATIWVKGEMFNPLSCVKERPALYMIEGAEKAGIIEPGRSVIIEPTSGNTGIGLAMVCAVKGYHLILTMPESMSLERRKILTHLGAELVLTDAKRGMTGAIDKAFELASRGDGTFVPQQFKNIANVKAHRETTGPEILEDMKGLSIDAFVAGVGTGGTITGVGGLLREVLGDKVKIVAVEPAESPVLSGQSPGPHRIQGIGAGFVPDILNRDVYDTIEKVDADEAIKTSRRMARLEGILAGISCGAAVAAALRVAAELEPHQNVVVVLPDTGERYLSTDLFDDEAAQQGVQG